MPATSALGSAFPKHANSGADEKSFFGKCVSAFTDLFNFEILPEGWRSHKIDVAGEQAVIFNAPAETPRAVAVYISGLQSSPLEYIGGINRLREQDISVISFSLLPATEGDLSGEKCRFVKRNSRLFEEILLNPKSKIHGMGDKALPRYVVPHSTASLVLQYTLAHGDNHDKALQLFDGAYNLNPFFDAGMASHHNPVRSLIYEWYAHGHANDPILSAALERLVIGKKEPTDYYYGTPTHGLVLGILEKSRPFVEKFLENPLPGSEGSDQKFPQTFVVGTKDSLVCNITTHEVAKALGSPVHEHPIDHSEALYHDDSLRHLVETIKTPRSDRHNTRGADLSLPLSFMPEALSRFF